MTFPSETLNDTTIATLLTPHGRGAVATIVVRGCLERLALKAQKSPVPFFLARNQNPVNLQPIGKIVFGSWGEEELVVCRTSEFEFEIHSHGGIAAVSRILQDLNSLGCSILEWSDYYEKADNLWDAEYIKAISQARTFRTAELLIQQRQTGKKLWEELDKCQDQNYWATLKEEAKNKHRKTVAQMLEWSDFGKHLVTPWNIVIGGLPNVGKSSLINALLGFERAIVVDQPGTTRDVVTGETALQGWPVLLSDTAGQRKTENLLETEGIERAIEAMKAADLQILLLDRSTTPTSQVQALIATFPGALLVFNKVDIKAAPDWNTAKLPESPIAVSCQTGEGVELLINTIIQKIIPRIPSAEIVLPVTKRHRQILRNICKFIE